MRTRNSFLNIVSNCICYVVLMLSGFVIRKLFAETLGMQCVGIDGRFTDYVAILTIIEINLGMNFIYKLYDPIARKDIEKISLIITFLKKSYIIISISILALGIFLSYFVVNSINEGFDRLWLFRIFFLYLADTVCSYFYYHKRVMIIANQQSRVIGKIRTCCLIVLSLVQFLILKISKSFDLYILAKIISRITENIFISREFKKKYNHINTNTKINLDENKKTEIFQNIKAMLFHKIGGAGLKQISSIIFGLVSLSLSESGIYYNYILIVTALLGISLEFFRGITASFGNLVNTEKVDKVEENFNVIFLINFFIYSFFCSSFFCISGPFMKFWISKHDACFGLLTTAAITLNLYIYGMRQSIGMAKESVGIYVQDRYFPILETIVNFIVSYFLTKKIGIVGVVIGSIISSLISFFTYPFFVYKILFKKSSIGYYKKYLIYAAISLFEVISCHFCTCLFDIQSNFLKIVSNSIICLIISVGISIMFFNRTREFSRIIFSFSELFGRFKNGFVNKS